MQRSNGLMVSASFIFTIGKTSMNAAVNGVTVEYPATLVHLELMYIFREAVKIEALTQ